MRVEARLSEWMRRYEQGEGEVLNDLCREIAPGMLNFLHRLVHERALAEDLLQEIFLRVQRPSGTDLV